jgi:hypothetical protein
MPRRLTNEINELRIRDNISGSEIVLYYRMPTTAERAAYANESFRRKGNRIEARMVETRQKHGKLILAGVREGDFEVKLGDRYQSIASDPSSENYAADWKELVAAHAGDLLELLAAHAFDGSAQISTIQSEISNAEEDLEKN